jgi:SAM-dependent methyltransferase
METPRWFPDELAHAGEEHLDPEYVQGYNRKAATDPAADLALLRASGLNETSTLVDLGAGTGAFALAAAPHCRRVIAVDVSAPMLGLLREQAERRAIANVEGVRSGFLTYQHQGDPADFVYSRNALHHLPLCWRKSRWPPTGKDHVREATWRHRSRRSSFPASCWMPAGPIPTTSLIWTRSRIS